MDVLYTIETDGLGKIYLKNATGEPIAQMSDNPDWSAEYHAEMLGHMVRHAVLEESYSG